MQDKTETVTVTSWAASYEEFQVLTALRALNELNRASAWLSSLTSVDFERFEGARFDLEVLFGSMKAR